MSGVDRDVSVRGAIFDVDGTLVATNEAHVEAWRRSFRAFGYDVTREQILPEVGKGGDNLVPAVIGEEGEAENGDRLRRRHAEEFLAIARSTRFAVLPGAIELLAALRERGLRTALATSSKAEHLEATLRSAGIDFRELVDEVVTATDAEASKPAPDIVVAAVDRLGLPPSRCLFVGDTPHDGTACAGAGVPFLGVTSGGNPAGALLEAGALFVWSDPGELLEHLDAALDIVTASRRE